MMKIKIMGHTINYLDKHLKSLCSREYINKASMRLMRHVITTKTHLTIHQEQWKWNLLMWTRPWRGWKNDFNLKRNVKLTHQTCVEKKKHLESSIRYEKLINHLQRFKRNIFLQHFHAKIWWQKDYRLIAKIFIDGSHIFKSRWECWQVRELIKKILKFNINELKCENN
jgi:hypothetical protein